MERRRLLLAEPRAAAADAAGGLLQGNAEQAGRLYELFDGLQNDIAASVDAELNRDTYSDAARWKSWVEEAMHAGAGRAHRWSKLPRMWAPPAVLTVGGKWSAHTSDLLAAEAERLSSIWQPECGDGDVSDECLGSLPTGMPPISADMVRDAALSFPRRTAETYDGFHVRHWGLLSLGGLEAVASLLNAVELVGMWPRQIEALTTCLIPEPKVAKYRGIALFPSLY